MAASRARPVAQVNVHEAKTRLCKLLVRVQRGDEIVIARAGKPVARLVPFRPREAPRRLGSAKGQIWIADDFDAPLPPELLGAFYGEE
jgi:prevent-host-death family protein